MGNEVLKFNLNSNNQLNKPLNTRFTTGGYTSAFPNSAFGTSNFSMPDNFSGFNTGFNMDSDFMSAGIFNQGFSSFGSNSFDINSFGGGFSGAADPYSAGFNMAAWTKQMQSIGMDSNTYSSRTINPINTTNNFMATRRSTNNSYQLDGTFESALNKTLAFEGGYSNDKDDKGGPTNYGITQRTYNSWCSRTGQSTQDVKNITKEEAKKIYYNDYWLASGADKISDPKMAFVLFDTSVLHGVSGAKKLFNQSDGSLNGFVQERKNSYSTNSKFYNGWMNRANSLG